MNFHRSIRYFCIFISLVLLLNTLYLPTFEMPIVFSDCNYIDLSEISRGGTVQVDATP